MDESERKDLVEAWIAFAGSEDGSPEQEELMWAFEEFSDSAFESPSLCLQLCEDALTYPLDDLTLAVLAAGPLEDVLVEHGAEIIDDVERMAADHPGFRHLLGGVWKNAMTEEVWGRVCKARDVVW